MTSFPKKDLIPKKWQPPIVIIKHCNSLVKLTQSHIRENRKRCNKCKVFYLGMFTNNHQIKSCSHVFFSFELSDDHHRIPSFIGCHQLFTQKLLQEKIVWSELQTDFKS